MAFSLAFLAPQATQTPSPANPAGVAAGRGAAAVSRELPGVELTAETGSETGAFAGILADVIAMETPAARPLTALTSQDGASGALLDAPNALIHDMPEATFQLSAVASPAPIAIAEDGGEVAAAPDTQTQPVTTQSVSILTGAPETSGAAPVANETPAPAAPASVPEAASGNAAGPAPTPAAATPAPVATAELAATSAAQTAQAAGVAPQLARLTPASPPQPNTDAATPASAAAQSTSPQPLAATESVMPETALTAAASSGANLQADTGASQSAPTPQAPPASALSTTDAVATTQAAPSQPTQAQASASPQPAGPTPPAAANTAAASATQASAAVSADAPAATPSVSAPDAPAPPPPQAGNAVLAALETLARPASAPAHPALRSAPPATAQVFAQITERFDGRAQRFEMRLDPPELGRVDIRIEIGADRRVSAVLAAHDSAALSDLMRGARALERALADVGVDLSENGLQFELSEDRRNGAHGRGRTKEPEFWRDGAVIALPVAAEAEIPSAPLMNSGRFTRFNLVA